MTEKDDGGPAFPRPDVTWPAGHEHGTQGQSGMSLRDWFAGQAMNGIIASCGDGAESCAIKKAAELTESSFTATVAKMSYEYADAMLKAREQ